eukprot:SAG11_NODE_2668_length_3114_cov_1.714096_1_plen_866_part_00
MRADGTSFLLRFFAAAGLTYQILANLREESAAAHLRLAIFPPEAIGSASSTGVASESNCQLPPAAQDLQSKDVAEMTFGTWGSPAHGQTWGEQHRCPDLTRVGPPEQGGCGGQYRYFPGQSFPSNHTWDWTAPFTANYVLQVTANCDVPFYDDPTQLGCTVTADDIECDDDRVTQCAAAIGLTIRVVDRSVHVKHTFDVPVTQEVLDSIELQQNMADMFALQQQPAIVFPLSINPLDCDNAARPGCQQVAGPGPGGRHRRRRLQAQVGADTDHAFPQSSFDTRDTAMRTSCGFRSSDAADPLLQGHCPSLECARALLPVLEDCAEQIAEFARHIGPEAAFYEALGRSEMFNSCLELDQSAAEMASVQVEFRAPTLEVAEQMILEHQRMVDAQFAPTSEADGGQRLCFGNPDASIGDATRCGGRRQLNGKELCARVCADKDQKVRRLEVELEKAKAETQTAVQRSAEKDMAIEQLTAELRDMDKAIDQQTKTIEKQANEIAFHKRLHRLKQNGVSLHNVSDSTRRNQTAVGRRTQAFGSSDASVLRSARVGADRAVKACAVHPCELSDGICQNGGTCVEAVGGGAVPFECQCVVGYAGDWCETDMCASMDCGEHGECVRGACECSDDWTGHRCETRSSPCLGTYFNVTSGANNADAPQGCRISGLPGYDLARGGYQSGAPCRCDDAEGGGPFGLGNTRTAWYRLSGAAGQTLPLLPPGDWTGGTYATSWLSGAVDIIPDANYAVRGSIPRFGEPPAERIVCFDYGSNAGVSQCYNYMPARVVNCGDFALFELSPIPSEFCDHSGNGLVGYVGVHLQCCSTWCPAHSCHYSVADTTNGDGCGASRAGCEGREPGYCNCAGFDCDTSC